jgi:ribonuclease BN (tRNA processing enzyme)
MELLVVGSGAAYPDRPGTASSCYVVLHDGVALCLDLGQGAFAGLAGRLEPAEMAAVVVSHLHPDHFVDLVALRHYLRYEFDPSRCVRVIGPMGLGQRLDGVTGETDFAAGTLAIEDRREGHVAVGPFDVESLLVTHTAGSFATRITLASAPDGPALVYSGDCGRAGDLAPLIRRGDVLLCEAAFGSGPIPVPDLHLDGAAVGHLAADTHVSLVLLTHIQMKRDPAATLAAVRAEFGGPVVLARDSDRVTVSG